VCYGVIALWGQGLHEFLDDCDHIGQSVTAALAPAEINGQVDQAGQFVMIGSPNGHIHDCDHCPICQFQALGQHFSARPAAVSALAVCEVLSPIRAEPVHCLALFSPAQPRAPPVAC